jgi:hypothetical protein
MDKDAKATVELALQLLRCSQKELSLRLKVSPTQISKWKRGEYMSFEMKDRIKKLIGIGDHQPGVILWAGSIEDAEKWTELFRKLAEFADEGSETGYDTYPLRDEMGLLSWSTVDALIDMGVAPPKTFPKELELHDDPDDNDEYWEALEKNPYASLVQKIYKSLSDVYGFYIAYVEELIDENDDLLNTAADNIEPCLTTSTKRLRRTSVVLDTKSKSNTPSG